MKNYFVAVLIALFLPFNSYSQTLETQSVGGCEKIVMTLKNLVYLVNTTQSNFGREITKFDYAKSTDGSKRGQYTDGKSSTSCYHSVIDRYDESMDQSLIYMTGLDEIAEPLKEQLKSMRSHYTGKEGDYMKYQFSVQGEKYDLFVKFEDGTNVVRLTKVY